MGYHFQLRRFIFLISGVCVLASALPCEARESGEPNTFAPGVTIGVGVGANPPPGVYYVNFANAYEASPTLTSSAALAPAQTTTLTDGSKLVWSTPYTFLGASEMAYVLKPYTNQELINKGVNSTTSGFVDTFFSPVNLSWTLGPDLYLGGMFGFEPPDGHYRKAQKINAGDHFWTFVPETALSYLADGYDLTLDAAYITNTKNTATGYTSGNQIILDGTATKMFGNWEVGPVSYYDSQTTTDQLNSSKIAGSTHPEQLALGSLLGYCFGSIKLQAWVTRDIVAENGGLMGTRYWTRLTIPLF